MVGAAFDHFRDVLCFLVDGHGSDDAAMRRRGGQLDLNRTCFGNLTVELLQQRRVLCGGKADTEVVELINGHCFIEKGQPTCLSYSGM